MFIFASAGFLEQILMLFFELLQIAIGNRRKLSQIPSAEEWRDLYTLAQKQAMVGIAFRGVEQLPQEQRPPKPLLMQWYMATEQIKKMNADLDRKALKVANNFLEDGFPGWVLKGQGIAQLYRVEKIENSKLKVENYHPDGDMLRGISCSQLGLTVHTSDVICWRPALHCPVAPMLLSPSVKTDWLWAWSR